MENKILINKMKNAAELAWVAYGYYDLMTSDTNQLFVVLKDEKGKDRIDSNKNPITQEIILTDIMDSSYAEHNVVGKDKWDKDFEKIGTLKGDFTPTQAKRFFDKYDLLDYYPKFDTKNNKQKKGFHACLFQDKKSKEYTLAIRGSFDERDYITDFFDLFRDSTIPFDYLHPMILFYESCAKKYPAITHPKSLNIVGHSLGGTLAQLFALSFADNANKNSIINEVYTFNAPGAKDLKLNITLDSKQIYEVNESVIKDSNPANAMYSKITNKDPNANTSWLENLKDIISQERNILIALKNYFSKIPRNKLKPHRIFLYSFYVSRTNTTLYQVYPVSDTFLQACQTLKYNYDNRNNKNYKLSISDRVFHIETQDKAYKENHTKESYIKNSIQHLGKDIDGNYFILNLNFGGLDSHSISSVTKILYFYSYLYEVNESLIDKVSKDVKIEYDLNKDKFLEEHSEADTQEYKDCKKALEYCNKITLAVHNILRQREIEKALAEGDYDDNNLIKVETPPNWLYAIIEQRFIELQIKKQERNMELPFKFEKNDTSNIIEAILHLQDNEVYIRILEEDLIKELEAAKALLAYSFAIHETSFFVGVDKNLNPIIQDSDTAASYFGYNEPKVIVFCNPIRTIDEKLFECYKEETLALYPNIG